MSIKQISVCIEIECLISSLSEIEDMVLAPCNRGGQGENQIGAKKSCKNMLHKNRESFKFCVNSKSDIR